MVGEEDKQKAQEGEGKVKRKMKTASQLDLLEKTYASKFNFTFSYISVLNF